MPITQQCRFLTQSGHTDGELPCPLLGAKRTSADVCHHPASHKIAARVLAVIPRCPRAERLFYFFRLDLLGGDPEWQVPHGLPFAIAGVACALDIVSELTATIRKNKTIAPMAALTSPDLLIFADRMSPSEKGSLQVCRKEFR